MTDDFNKYMNVVIRNTEILTEFTGLVKRIEDLVMQLPNSDKFNLYHEELRKLKADIENLIIEFKTSVQADHDKMDKIPSISHAVDNIKDDVKDECKNTNSIYTEIQKISSTFSRMSESHEEIKKTIIDLNIWAKVKFPFIMGTITLILYAIGFYIQFRATAKP